MKLEVAHEVHVDVFVALLLAFCVHLVRLDFDPGLGTGDGWSWRFASTISGRGCSSSVSWVLGVLHSYMPLRRWDGCIRRVRFAWLSWHRRRLGVMRIAGRRAFKESACGGGWRVRPRGRGGRGRRGGFVCVL